MTPADNLEKSECEYDFDEQFPPYYSPDDIDDMTCIISQSEAGGCSGMEVYHLVNSIPEIIAILNYVSKEPYEDMPDDFDEDEIDYADYLCEKFTKELASLEESSDGEITKEMIPSVKKIISKFNKTLRVGIVDVDCVSSSNFKFIGRLPDFLKDPDNTEEFLDAIQSA
ncbi:MAG: hypothetical protein WCI71_17235, partial [Bacteroidota bacterium]